MRISLTTEPMPHQVEAVERIGGLKVGGLFMDMGTGKSLTAMMLAARRAEKIDRVWWGCPCSLRAAVVEQIKTHSDIADGDVVVMDGRTPDAAIEAAAWVVFGLESVGQSDAVTLKLARHVGERSMMVLDESTYIKGARAKRTDRLTKIAAVCRYRLVMSGTPLTQGLVDIYSQMRFLSPKILGYRSFWSFQQAHIEYRHEERRTEYGKRYTVRTNHIIGYRGGETIVANVAPYVHQVRKDECLTLPDKVYDTLAFDMTEEQADEYERVKRELLLDRPIDDFFGSSSSIALFRLFSALQRVVAGIPADVPHRRIKTLMRWVRAVDADEPVVIWTKYHRCADAIGEALAEEFGEGVSAIYDGRVGDRGRQANLRRWRDREARFLLATQDSGGHGLTLVECANAAFYADGFKYSNRLQAEDRFHRIGQTRSPRMSSLICRSSIDERIAENHRSKGATLSAFRQGLDKGKRRDARARLIDFVGGAKKSAGGLTSVEL